MKAAVMSRLPALPTWRPSRRSLALIAALAVLFAAWWLIPGDARLTQLEVRGSFTHLQPADVRAAAEPLLVGSFFSVDLDAVRDAVGALPWVARVRVERQWPGAISVRVWERQAYARWNESGVLDIEGRVFVPRPADVPTGLPRLGGSPGHENEVAQTWQRLAPALQGTPLELQGLALDARGEWTARTVTGIELRFGQNPPDERLAILTQVARRALEARWTQVQHLDLRYTNGFAVGWREAGTTGESSK